MTRQHGRFKQATRLLVMTLFCMQAALARIGTDWPEIMEAAFQGDLGRVIVQLDRGADVNVRMDDGTTPLLVAASRGHQAIVKALLDRGADIDSRNRAGWTALMLATKQRHTPVVKLLLKKGADRQIKNRQGNTAPMLAESVGMAHLFEVEPVDRSKKDTAATLAVQLPATDPEVHQVRPKKTRIGVLLERAAQQLDRSHLTYPANDNAFATYRQVLELEPDNKTARTGIARIADRYAGIARKRKQLGELDRGLSSVERGLMVQPNHTGLLALQQELQDLKDAQQRPPVAETTPAPKKPDQHQREIARLLSRAEEQLARENLSTPAGNNALETYQRILELDPGNSQAQAGLERIVSRYEQLARRECEQENLNLCLTYIERGLSVNADSVELLDYRLKAQERLAEQERQKQAEEDKRHTLARLAEEAEGLLAEDRLTQPANRNAWAIYRQMLDIDSNNKTAQQGLERIVSHYRGLSRQSLERGELAKSLDYATVGLQVLPGDSQLLMLTQKVHEKIKEQKRQAAAKEERRREIQRLLSEADVLIDEGKLTRPEGQNAWILLQKVLHLAPANQTAQSGLERIAVEYQQRGRQSLESGDLERSLAHIDEGLKVLPDDRQLLDLQKEAQTKLEERQRLLAEQDAQRKTIASLLQRAEQQLNGFRLTDPEGDNALETYQKILRLQPDNVEALAIPSRIAEKYHELANEALHRNAYELSLDFISRGLAVVDGDLALTELREHVEAELEVERQRKQEQQRRRRIASLLQQAEQRFKSGKLVEPSGENAWEIYRQILQIDPQDADAQKGLLEISKHFESLARESLESGDGPQSLDYAEAGLRVLPDQQGLKDLYAKAQVQIQEQARRQAQEAERRRQVARLIKRAERQFAASQLIKPVGDNAYESYREVLHLEPGNAAAKAGLSGILAEYRRLSQRSLEARQFDESYHYATDGLTVQGDDEQLLALRREAQAQLKQEERRRANEAERQRTIRNYLADARRQLKVAHLVSPPEDNAYESLRQVLQLDPHNAEAKQHMIQLVQRFVSTSREQLRNGELAASLESAQAGLQVQPEDPQLLSLRDQAMAKLEQQRKREADMSQQRRQVRQLLAKAERQLGASRFIEPMGENAYESYQQVLQLEPGNSEAKAGLFRMAERYKQLSRRSLREGNLSESLVYAAAGLKVMPNDKALMRLQDEARAKIDEAELQRKMQELERQQQIARLMAEARRKESDYRRIERQLDAQEQALQLSIQQILVRKWGYLRNSPLE